MEIEGMVCMGELRGEEGDGESTVLFDFEGWYNLMDRDMAIRAMMGMTGMASIRDTGSRSTNSDPDIVTYQLPMSLLNPLAPLYILLLQYQCQC